MSTALRLDEHLVHLDPRTGASAEPVFTGDMQWYADYLERHAADGIRGRLVSLHTFTSSWDGWECHPNGDEVVVCLSGSLTLLQRATPQAEPVAPTLRAGSTPSTHRGCGTPPTSPPAARPPRCSSPPGPAPSTGRADLRSCPGNAWTRPRRLRQTGAVAPCARRP